MTCPKPCSDPISRAIAAAVLSVLVLAGCEPTSQNILDSIEDTEQSRAMAQLDPLILGHSFMDAGDPEAALKAFYRAGAEQGLTAEILSGLGSANLALGRLGQAEKLLRTAVEEDPKFTAAWNNLGVVLANRQIWGEAREVFRLAFALSNGESTEIRDNLALAEDKFEEIPTISDPNAKFRLVRQGNGRYLLTGT